MTSVLKNCIIVLVIIIFIIIVERGLCCVTKNADIKSLAKSKGVYLYEVAKKLGIRDTKLSVLLREELSDKEKQTLTDIINAVAFEKEQERNTIME